MSGPDNVIPVSVAAICCMEGMNSSSPDSSSMDPGIVGSVFWAGSSGWPGIGPPSHTGVTDPERPLSSDLDASVVVFFMCVLQRGTWSPVICFLTIARGNDQLRRGG